MRIQLALACALSGTAYAEPTDHASTTTVSPTRSHERFPDGEKIFREAKGMLLKDDVDDTMSEEDLYRGAVAGMLAASGRKWDALLSPDDLAEMENELNGNIVGIGAEIDFDTDKGFPTIISTFPGSPAEKAGIQSGDRIMRVDGKSARGLDEHELLRRIRGKEGTTITLALLRDDQTLTKTITRKKLTVSVVNDVALPDGAALVWIRGFNDKTPDLLRAALTRIAATHPRGLVLDLRHNQGGLLEKMLECAGQLLPKGSVIVSEMKRGKKEEQLRTSADPLIKVPLAILTDNATASGAEMLAGALRDDLGAHIVGARTHGKWNAQMVSALSNGYAMKFTIGLFRTPKGQSPDGKGLDPDVPVDMDEGAIGRAQRQGDVSKRLAVDAQLRAALALLR